jgi:hypothetical protein
LYLELVVVEVEGCDCLGVRNVPYRAGNGLVALDEVRIQDDDTAKTIIMTTAPTTFNKAKTAMKTTTLTKRNTVTIT